MCSSPEAAWYPAPAPHFLAENWLGLTPQPPGCLSPSQPLFPYLQKRIIFATPGISEGLNCHALGRQVLRGRTSGSGEEVQEGLELLLLRRGGSWGSGWSSGVCLTAPAGPTRWCASPPAPPPGPGADPRAGTLCSQQSCPARPSHGNLAAAQPLTPAPRRGPAPTGPPMLAPH